MDTAAFTAGGVTLLGLATLLLIALAAHAVVGAGVCALVVVVETASAAWAGALPFANALRVALFSAISIHVVMAALLVALDWAEWAAAARARASMRGQRLQA